MDDYDDDDDGSASSGLKRLGVSLGLKLRPWEGPGLRSAKSEVSLIDFTDDSFSSTTPSPLTETQQPDEDTLKVELGFHSATNKTFTQTRAFECYGFFKLNQASSYRKPELLCCCWESFFLQNA